MTEALTIISVSITIIAVGFLFLYVRKSEEYAQLKSKVELLTRVDQQDHEVQQAREDFLAMVVHEMRSPLAVIRGSADLILKETDNLSEGQIADLLGQIKNSSSHLLDMVSDLLDVSKIEAGKFEIFVKEQDINKTINDEAHSYEALAKQHGLKLILQLDESLPKIKFDSEKIDQVLNNLLSNAIKFTPREGVITIETRRQNNYAQVVVSDTGSGIPDFLKAKLFNKFVQGKENGVSHEKGTGLGLVISKGIVEAHGGTVWVEDNHPRGSKFIFTLPLS
ncbi:MAG TPA: HAMP domain-containing sensor histidine kinase [Patescibacteria group bacterium]|nr:HAMP domain-containing sensor histidine kinase [Patescibacteria group bacterium]